MSKSSLTALTLLTATIAASASGVRSAKPSSAVRFPHTALFLPVAKGLHADWVLKPIEKNGVATKKEERLRFDVDADGKPWFGDGSRRLLVDPVDGSAVLSNVRFADFVFTAGGARVICTDEYLGELKPPPGEPRKEKGLPVLPFWGRVRLPHPGCRLYPAGPDGVYIVWHNEKTGRDDLSLLQKGDGSMHATKLFDIDAQITAVAGDGRTTFIGVKDWILRLAPGAEKYQLYFMPKRPVTGLAYSRRAGLFYATPDAVGFVSPGFQIEPLKSPHPQIVLRGDALYIRMARTLGVIRIDGVDRLKDLRWPQAAKAAPAAR